MNKIMFLITFLIIGDIILLISTQASIKAIPAPWSMCNSEELKLAHESLIIKVQKVEKLEIKNTQGTTEHIKIEAVVEQVINSSSGLEIGDTIYINYTQFSLTPPTLPDYVLGPAPISSPIVKQGEVWSAYLRRIPPYSSSDKVYTTAAGYNSFNLCHRWREQGYIPSQSE